MYLQAKGVELQIPDEAKRLLQANPEQAAALIQSLTWLAIGVLAGGIAMLFAVKPLFEAGILPRRHGTRIVMAIIIFTFSAFLVIAGYGQQQFAWLTAIFGAVIGYLFRVPGDERRPPISPPPAEPPAKPQP